jgi:ABC-type phosphate/phosphonate transport system permease subunit
MLKLYPVLPWCFLIGALLSLAWVLAEKAAPHTRRYIQARISEKQCFSFHQYFWLPAASVFNCINPAVALSGALNWASNNNLTYATLGIYIAWFFQFFLKRRYTARRGKYAYLIFAGLNVGVAISSLIVTLVFSFGAGKNVSFHWWGNDVARRGIDWQLYNNNASLIPLPASGYFGLAPDQYPLEW